MAAQYDCRHARNMMHQQSDSSFHPRADSPQRTPRPFRTEVCLAAACAAAVLFAAVSAARAADTKSGATSGAASAAARYFMPDAAASKIVTVMNSSTPAASIVVLTEAVAVNETGPKATVEHFGEVYAFAPSFIAVHRDEPTRITLWNLQPDDYHDLLLEDRTGGALMHLRLAPLSTTSYVYTFHREGLFSFRCAVHQP
jgi:hypothetical protein